MRVRIKKALAAAAVFAVASAATVVGVGGGGSAAAAATGLRAYGITANGRQLLTFTTDMPEVVDWFRNVTGLSGDTFLIGIDFRVQDGKLYGVGNHGGIYTIAMPSAALTKVSQLSVPLHGTTFGVDFNPAADRLRVDSDTGQNLRHNLNDGVTTTDTALSASGISGAAYTNNDLNGTTATTLFVVNPHADQVAIQSPANNGLIAPTGSLGVDAGAGVGFDIFSDLSGGRTGSNTAFAVFTPPTDTATLHGIDLLTGAATPIGEFPLMVGDIAVALDAG